jgi:hypothetical protein
MHHYPAQHNHLVTERSIFGFKSALRLKWRDQDGKNKTEQRDHCAPTLGDSLPQLIRIRFSVHTTKFDASRPAETNEAVVKYSPDDVSDSIALVPEHSEIREFRLLTNDNLTPGASLFPRSEFDDQSILLNQSQIQDW